MAEGRIEATLGVTDIISKVEALSRVARGAHGSTVKLNSALSGLDKVRADGLDKALDSVFAMIDSIKELEQQIDKLSGKQLSVGLDNKEKKRLTELTGITQAKHGVDKRASKDKQLPSKLGDAQKKLATAMGGEEGKQLEFLDKLLVARKDLIKAENEHQQIQKFNKTSTGKFEEFIKRQVSAIKARIAAGKELTEVQKRFLKLVQDKALAGKDMGKLGGSAQALGLSELKKETNSLAAAERKRSEENERNDAAERDRKKRLSEELKRDTIFRIKNGKDLTKQQQRIVDITKKMIDQNRVRAGFRGVAAQLVIQEKKLAAEKKKAAAEEVAENKRLQQIAEQERSKRKEAFEEFKRDTAWRIRNNQKLNTEQQRLVEITKKMIDQERVRSGFRPVAAAILVEERKLARERQKNHGDATKQNVNQEKQIRDVVRAIKEKIRASDNLRDEELDLIRSTQKMVQEGRTLTTVQRRLASSLNLSANSVEFFDKKVKLTNTTIASLRLLISRARNAVLLFTFALRPALQGLTAVVNKTIEYEKATTGLITVAEKFGIRSNQVHEAIHRLTNDGLLKVTEASKGLRNLLSTGIGMDRAIKTMMALKDAAAFNRQGMLGLGEAVVGATDGIKNMISRMVDNAGITKNISVILEDQAKIYGKQVSALTELEKHILIVDGVQKEAAMFNGDAIRLSDTLAGSFDKLGFSLDAFLRTLGGAIENKLGLFSGFANIVTTMANQFTHMIEVVDQSPALRAALNAQKLGVSETTQNELNDLERMAAASKATDAFRIETEKRMKIAKDWEQAMTGLDKESFTVWEYITGFGRGLVGSTGPLGVGSGGRQEGINPMEFGDIDKTMELQRWMGKRGESFSRNMRSAETTYESGLNFATGETQFRVRTPDEVAEAQHEIARRELMVIKGRLKREHDLIVESVEKAKHMGEDAHRTALEEGAKVYSALEAAMKPMQDALRDIMQNTKAVTEEIDKSGKGTKKLTTLQIQQQEKWAANMQAGLLRRTEGEEGGELKRQLEKEGAWFVEQARKINQRANEVNKEGVKQLTEERKKELLAHVETQKKIRLKQIRDDFAMEQREEGKRVTQRMEGRLARAEPTIFDRRREAAKLAAERDKEAFAQIELSDKLKKTFSMTPEAVDAVLAKQLLQIDRDEVVDAADKAAVLWVKEFNEKLKREQREKSITLAELEVEKIKPKLRNDFWARLMGSDDKAAIDKAWENTKQILQEKEDGIIKIENMTETKRKQMLDTIDTERLTAKEKYYKDLLALYKEFIGEQNKVDAEHVSGLERVEDGLGDVSRAFGNVATAARFAGDAGIDGLDSIAKKGQLVAQSLSQAAGGVRQLQQISELGGMGSIAGSMSAVGGIAAIAGAGFMAYSALKGPGEGEKARSRFNRTGDLGASISRGPNTININPSIVVQAEGDVLFSQDSIDVFRTRLVEEMQQAIDNNEIRVEGY